MRKLIGRRSRKAGLPPGSLVHVGEVRRETARVTVLDYDAEHVEEREVAAVAECLVFRDKPTVTWVNVAGLRDAAELEKLGECYGLHPLVLEDILNTEQRPKLEDYGEYLFVVLKMIYYDDQDELVAEQISLIVGPSFVISFQENGADVFDPVRERIRSGKGRVRKSGADYLAYALIDAVVDNYFAVLEKIGDEVEDMEEELLARPSSRTLQSIHDLKREMVFLRKSAWPLREMVSAMQRAESPLIQETTVVYLRDVHDHAIQVIDTIESLRDIVVGMLDTYLSSVSNRMNEVMKVLTIIATVFIPLTFVAGVYGMNFQHMPELGWHYSYPIIWLVFVGTTVWMIAFFRRKQWL